MGEKCFLIIAINIIAIITRLCAIIRNIIIVIMIACICIIIIIIFMIIVGIFIFIIIVTTIVSMIETGTVFIIVAILARLSQIPLTALAVAE